MNKYNTAFIKKYIEEHKDEIQSVSCGMQEDWLWTAQTVWEDGAFEEGFDWNSKSICVAGIDGSTWATPIMKVLFKDERTELVDCFFDDGDIASPAQIAEQKAFSAATGGRPIE